MAGCCCLCRFCVSLTAASHCGFLRSAWTVTQSGQGSISAGCYLPPAPLRAAVWAEGWLGCEILNYLHESGQSLSVKAAGSESKSGGATERSLQGVTSFTADDDGYICNGFRERTRDVRCLHLLLPEGPSVCPGDDQGAGTDRVQAEALCV